MKVLIVHSGKNGRISPYIQEQANSLEEIGIDVDFFAISKSGVLGYLSHFNKYYAKLREFKPDIVHAHYGLSGLFANVQRKVPVITSFHGSDVYIKKIWFFSKTANLLSKETVFVSKKLKQKLNTKKGEVITCGVDFGQFYPREEELDGNYFALFAGGFDNPVKNYPLAQASVDEYNKNNDSKIELVELINYSREEVANLMRRARFLLITSAYEGSSQVLKEAMASNCPVISTNVGSVSELLENSSGIIVEPDFKTISKAIKEVLIKRTNYSNGRLALENQRISLSETAKKLSDLYSKVLLE